MTARRTVAWMALTAMLGGAGACASRTPPAPVAPAAPKFPEYEMPAVPAALSVQPQVSQQYTAAWQRFQAGDLRGALRDLNAVLKRAPAFYPADASAGYVQLADREFKQAVARFEAALRVDRRYLPALTGLADAQLGAGDERAAVETMARILDVDPSREAVRTRLELLKFKQVQELIDEGRRAREANRLDDSESLLERALALSPSSAVILRELALGEVQRGALDAAEEHARAAVKLDPFDAETHASLGAVLEARGQFVEATASFSRAAAIDSRYRERVTRLRERAATEAVPAELRDMPTAPTVTRAQAAALVGRRLEAVIDRAPKRATAVATDVRGHWAAAWIVKVTQAGVMEISPNHTFQPAVTVRRGDLARIVTQILTIGAAARPEFNRWKAARPRFGDLPPTNLFYNAAAMAVSSGVMAAAEGDRFLPLRPVTGAEVLAAIDRLERLVR